MGRLAQQPWQQDFEKYAAKMHIMMGLGAMVVFPALAIIDYRYMSEAMFNQSVLIRVIVCFLLFLSLLLSRYKILTSQLVVFVVTLLPFLACGYISSQAPLPVLLAVNIYYVFSTLIFTIVLLWSWQQAAFISLLTVGSNLIMYARNSSYDWNDFFANGGIFFIGVFVIAPVLCNYWYQHVRKRFYLVHELSEKSREISRMNQELETKNRMLVEMNGYLAEKACTDSLTELYNHQHIIKLLHQLLRKRQEQVSIMMIDIDYFKKVNDRFGHQTGDRVLVRIAQVIKDSIRGNDIVGRYGGEEFFVILPRTNSEDALRIANRIRESVEQLEFTDILLEVTVSIGLAHYRGEEISEFISRADQLLYQAKQSGRNRIAM